ncbi:MAG: TetR family transcriptional regulator C-terminal domain-containing protein, partial [Haliea sp.]
QKRVHRVLAKDPCDLQGCLEAMLPLDKLSSRDWKIYFAFWQVATFNPDFTEQEKRSTQHARDLIAITLDARREAGLLSGPVDIPSLAIRLLTIVQGVAIQAIVDGNVWSHARQRKFLANELALSGLSHRR